MVNTPTEQKNSINQSMADSYIPWIKRNGFSHGGMALLWILAAFIAFFIFTNVVSVVLVFVWSNPDFSTMNAAAVAELFAENLDLAFIANSAGQILFLALATWWFSRVHTTKANRPLFFRFSFHTNTMAMIGVVVALILAAQPAIWFLGWINSFVPVPDALESMQLQQMEMMQTYLTGDGIIWVALFNIAIVPAVCEEILFRGYVLQSFEKSWGIGAAIIISGIIFGLYHLQLANVLPLAGIGMLLAYMTWVTQSIYPAMVAHFVNNGASVLFAKYYPETAISELSPQTMPPMGLVAVSVVVSVFLIYFMLNKRVKMPTNTKRGADVTRSETERY